MQNNAIGFGFDIITEKITDPKFDKKAHEAGLTTRQDNIQYFDDASILQSILEYSINFGTENYFKSRDLSKLHLLKNCVYYIKLYGKYKLKDKTKLDARVESMNPRVIPLLFKLIHLKLIEFEFYETDNHQVSEKYQFTKLGRLIGLLISYKKDKNKISKDLYNHILDFYDSMDHSLAKLCSIFFRKSYNSPIYDKMIDLLVDLLDNADNDKDLFINQVKKFTPILNKESWNMLYDSFSEFDKKDPLKYEILFYNFKIYLEEIQKIKSKRLKEFEEFQFSLISEPFIVALDGYCHKCNHFSLYGIGLINYFRLCANIDSDNIHLIRAKCLNPICNNDFLNFDFVDNVRILKEKQDVMVRKKKNIILRVSETETEIDIVGTIFEKTLENNFTIRSKRFQTVLAFLLDNQGKFFKISELQNAIILERDDLFNYNSSESSSNIADNFYKQFVSYVDVFKICSLVEYIKVPSETNESVMVDAYQLSPFGKTIALIAKIQNNDFDPQIYEEIYRHWKAHFDRPPSSSLDLFCKKYLQSCKESESF